MPKLVSYAGININTRDKARTVKRLIMINRRVNAKVVDQGAGHFQRWTVEIVTLARETLSIKRSKPHNLMARYEVMNLTQTRYNGLNERYRSVTVYVKPTWLSRRLTHF